MKTKFTDRSTLYCFTPAVSLATFLIEFLLAIYVVARYKMNNFNRLAVLLLLFLGLFQFSEYMICKSDQVQFWAKIGIASITLLPILSLHLITYMTEKSKWLWIGYFFAGLIILLLFTVPFENTIQCTGKFVVLEYTNPIDILFTIYYYGFLMAGLIQLLIFKNKSGIHDQESFWMMIAYLSFILPTMVVFIFSQLTPYAIPSIMCGFAILFAVILVTKIVPGFNNKKRE